MEIFGVIEKFRPRFFERLITLSRAQVLLGCNIYYLSFFIESSVISCFIITPLPSVKAFPRSH